MRKFMVLLKKDVMEQMRSRKLLILAAIFIFLALASPISAKMLPQILKTISLQGGITINIPEPTFSDAIDQFVKNTAQLVVLLLIFVVAGAVVDEKSKKTLELVLVKPVSRTAFILSKFFAYFLTISLSFIVSAIVFYLYTVSLFASFSFSRFLIVAFLALIYVLLVISITIFASTLAKSTAIAGAVGFLSSISFSLLNAFKTVADYSPGYVFSNYKELMLNGWGQGFLPPAVISLALIVVLLLASARVFRQQEIER